MKNISKTVVWMLAVGFSLGLLSGCMGMMKKDEMMDKEMKEDGMMKKDKMMDKEMKEDGMKEDRMKEDRMMDKGMKK